MRPDQVDELQMMKYDDRNLFSYDVGSLRFLKSQKKKGIIKRPRKQRDITFDAANYYFFRVGRTDDGLYLRWLVYVDRKISKNEIFFIERYYEITSGFKIWLTTRGKIDILIDDNVYKQTAYDYWYCKLAKSQLQQLAAHHRCISLFQKEYHV